MQQLSQEWWKFESPDMDPEHIEERLQTEAVDPDTVAALVLGGGTGDGLYPLTEVRTAPAALPCAASPGTLAAGLGRQTAGKLAVAAALMMRVGTVAGAEDG